MPSKQDEVSNPQSASVFEHRYCKHANISRDNICLLMTKKGSFKEFLILQEGNNKRIDLVRTSCTSSTSKVEHDLEKAHITLMPEYDATKETEGKHGLLYPLKLTTAKKSTRKLYF